MKTTKLDEKSFTNYIIKDGSKTFRFVEYKEDVYADTVIHTNKKKPLNKKGDTQFFILMDNFGLPFAMWSNIKDVHTLKRAKEWAEKLLESCLVDYNNSDITKVAMRAIMPKYKLHNLSQWWSWVYEEYNKKGI